MSHSETHFLLAFWIQIATAICCEFIHIQSFATYHLRLHSLPLTLRYMDKFSQLLPQLTFIKRNACYACFSPTDRRSSGPPACATHTFRPFPTASQADAFTLALLRRAPTFQVSAFHRFHFSLRRTAVPPPFIIPFIQPTRVNTPQLEPDEAGPSVSPCRSLQV